MTVSGLSPGYEDLNDQQRLRLDPLPATVCKQRDPAGQDWFNPAFHGVPLSGSRHPG